MATLNEPKFDAPIAGQHMTSELGEDTSEDEEQEELMMEEPMIEQEEPKGLMARRV